MCVHMSCLFSLALQYGDFTLDIVISGVLGRMRQDFILYLGSQLQLKYMHHVVEMVATSKV